MLTDNQPRVSIAHLPTPLEPLPRLTAQLGGPALWIKRDDQTGLATGGNKARKLEFLVADALAGGADTLISGGAGQSNHARQTAAAAAKSGLPCTLVLRGAEPPQMQGNLLLDWLLGARVVWQAVSHWLKSWPRWRRTCRRRAIVPTWSPTVAAIRSGRAGTWRRWRNC